jgi:hypothetical protein
MTDDMGRLLQDASDDGGRPVGFAMEELVVRGRRRVRQRRSSFAAVAGVAALGLAASAVTGWPSGVDRDSSPAISTGDDAALIEHCAELDDAYREETGHADSKPIDDWSIKVRQADSESISMILAPQDQREVAFCRLDLTGLETRDDYWRGTDISVVDAPADPTAIGDDMVLWSSAGTMSDKIGRMTYETADGVVTEAARFGRYYVWQHETTDVGPDETVWVTFYQANSDEVAFRTRANDTLYSSDPPPMADPSAGHPVPWPDRSCPLGTRDDGKVDEPCSMEAFEKDRSARQR